MLFEIRHKFTPPPELSGSGQAALYASSNIRRHYYKQDKWRTMSVGLPGRNTICNIWNSLLKHLF